MAFSYVQLPGDGTTTNFNFTFGYLSRTHVGVKVNGVVTPFTWLTDFSVQISPAPAAGTVVEIRRTTPLNQPAVVWNDGATLTEEDMNLDSRFNLYANQESRDANLDAVTKNPLGVWDGQGRETTNFADPTSMTGLVTRNYFENEYTPQLDAKVTEATNQATAAANSASASQGYAAAADASADTAASLLGLFRGQYLGSLPSNPTVDGNGNPVTAGDLYFNSTDSAMKVYTGTAWVNAGSTVQGTINKPLSPVVATAGQTTVGVPGGYDSNFIIVFLNGVKVTPPDITITSGTDIVFTTPLTSGDEVDWVAFGAFNVANATPADGSVSDQKVFSGSKLANRINSLVDVKDPAFGAKGDGVTDDTAAIQAAINYAASIGALLWLPQGTFIVSAAINLTSNTHIAGVGEIKLKDNCTPKPADILRCNTASNVTLSGITVNANRQNNVDHGTPDGSGNQPQNWQGTLVAAIDYAYVTDFSIENVTVKECWGSGIWLTDCENGKVQNNRIKNHRITGIAVRNNTADSRPIQNIRVTGNHVDGGIVGIHFIFGSKDSVCNDNVCVNNKDPNRFPAYAYSGTYPNVWPSTGGFTPFGSGGYASPAFQGDGAGIEATGVFTDPAGTANLNVSIAGNTCNFNAVGVRLEETSNKFAITGNTCRSNDFYGILLYSAYFNVVAGNTCTLNGLDGIHLEKVVGKPKASNNTLTGNICTENQRFGVAILGSDGNILQGNNLSGNGGNTGLSESGSIGLYLSDAVAITATLIEGNQLQNYYGTDKYGIYSNSASNVGNMILGNAFSGSYVTAKTNLDTTNNTFSRNLNYRSESKGVANITAGNTFVDVAHGLDFIPASGAVQVTPVNDYGTTRWWLQSVGATNIRIQVNAAPAGTLTFVWNVNA